MFGMMEAMLGFLRRQVGLRTDAADEGGSAHAKLTHIDDHLNALIPGTPFHLKTPTLTRVSTSTNGTILTINGPRIILGGIVLHAGSCNSSYQYWTGISITIDGKTVVNTGTSGINLSDGRGEYLTWRGDDSVYGYEKAYNINGPFRINTSLIVSGAWAKDRGQFAAAIWHVPV